MAEGIKHEVDLGVRGMYGELYAKNKKRQVSYIPLDHFRCKIVQVQKENERG